MHLSVQDWIQQFGYFGVFFILLLEMIGIPFPAETTLTLSGIEWANGHFSLFLLLASAAMGNIIGSSIAYTIGRFLGRPILLRFGKMFRITNEKIDQTEEKFQKYTVSIVLFSKFIAGIRVLVPYLAGMNRMSFLKFTIINMISAFVWSGVFIILGRYIGIAWDRYHQVMHQFLLPTIVLILIGISLYFAFKQSPKKQQG